MLDYYKGKRILLTGHTGFKGSWLSWILLEAGAEVTGYALEPPDSPSLFSMSGIKEHMRSEVGDVRDFAHLHCVVRETKPEIVFHLAAQPLVRESYRLPRETYETNVMGTVNLLEALRLTDCARSIVNVTTDKVYLNREEARGYVEEDPLDGYDPYSNSKSCSDLVTHSYRCCFLAEQGAAVSTMRAGNVIGGGDFAADRIVPDCVRAALKGEPIVMRNPEAVRPFQHVLEPLSAYLLLAERQAEDPSLAGAYNIGPGPEDAVQVRELVECFIRAWGEGASCVSRADGGPHEAKLLMLDSTKIMKVLGWRPMWGIREAVEKTVAWHKAVQAEGQDAASVTISQIKEFFDV